MFTQALSLQVIGFLMRKIYFSSYGRPSAGNVQRSESICYYIYYYYYLYSITLEKETFFKI